MTEITFSDSLTSIGVKAFYYCTSLSKVTCLAKDVPEIGDGCFYIIDEEAVLYVYTEVLEDYKNSDWVKYFAEILPIDEAGVDSLPDSSFDSYKVFNLNGINILNTKNKAEITELPSGIYIINGKKAVIGK